MTIEELYEERLNRPTHHADIYEHLPTLRLYASQCRVIVEIGVRTGNSTTGLLAGLADAGGGTLHSFDLWPHEFQCPKIPGVEWSFTRADSTAEGFEAPACDLLFIDGDHKYEAVRADLRHAAKAAKYVILHDTNEERDRQYGDGVCKAMDDFLEAHPEWQIRARFRNCNGLTVLHRT